MDRSSDRVLERGDIHLLYRPAVGAARPAGLLDVADLHVVLVPDEGSARLTTIGKKRLPDTDEQERFWGYVVATADEPAELAAWLAPDGGRQPGARPAGSGRYAIVARGRGTELAYHLALPDDPGAVQEAMRLEPAARYVLAVKNPAASSPPEAGLPDGMVDDLPAEVFDAFDGRRWIGAEPPSLLGHRGVEFVLVGTDDGEDILDEIGLGVPSRDADGVLERLDLDPERHPVAPLVDGVWA